MPPRRRWLSGPRPPPALQRHRSPAGASGRSRQSLAHHPHHARAATRRVRQELDRSKAAELVADLTTLAEGVSKAIEAVQSGTRINAHIIANASMITASIARWNLALELLPLTVDEERTAKER